MKRSLLAAALLAATATTALAANTNQITLRTAGYWTAWYNPSNTTNGLPMCAMGSNMNMRGGIAGFMIKYSGGGVFVHAYKTGWTIPKGSTAVVTLTFDNATP